MNILDVDGVIKPADPAWIAQRALDALPVAPTPADVIAERERRLALGFAYDFEDERGVHHIATTPEDMKGWDEVTMLANAAINAGVAATEILILTSTGPVTVTAAEWQQVLLASANFRQPIWQTSFALQAMDPIPADVTDDVHWPD
jgi:hypothetical protein